MLKIYNTDDYDIKIKKEDNNDEKNDNEEKEDNNEEQKEDNNEVNKEENNEIFINIDKQEKDKYYNDPLKIQKKRINQYHVKLISSS